MLKGCPTLMRGSPLGDAPGTEAVICAQRCYEWEVTNGDRVSFCVAASCQMTLCGLVTTRPNNVQGGGLHIACSAA